MAENPVKMGLKLMISDEKMSTRSGNGCCLAIMKGFRREDSEFAQ